MTCRLGLLAPGGGPDVAALGHRGCSASSESAPHGRVRWIIGTAGPPSEGSVHLRYGRYLTSGLLRRRRFEQFQSRLGLSRNILTQRLERLVEEGCSSGSLTRSGRLASSINSRRRGAISSRCSRRCSAGGIAGSLARRARRLSSVIVVPVTSSYPRWSIGRRVSRSTFEMSSQRRARVCPSTWRPSCPRGHRYSSRR